MLVKNAAVAVPLHTVPTKATFQRYSFTQPLARRTYPKGIGANLQGPMYGWRSSPV